MQMAGPCKRKRDSAQKGSGGTIISSKRRPVRHCRSRGKQIATRVPGSQKFAGEAGKRKRRIAAWAAFSGSWTLTSGIGRGNVRPPNARKQGKFFGRRGVDTA